MSPRAFIITRDGKRGRRWHVRWIPRGQRTPVHWGSFTKKKEALEARDYVNGELAVGRWPDPRNVTKPEAPKTVLEGYDEWVDSLPKGTGDSVRKRNKNARSYLEKDQLARIPIRDASFRDVQRLINRMAEKLAAETIRKYLEPVRAAFDFHDVSPNPAVDRRLKTPRKKTEIVKAPSRREYDLIRGAMTPGQVPHLEFIEAHGTRIGETRRLTWADIDLAGGRIRVQETKEGTGGIRFVPLDAVWQERLSDVPMDDRVGPMFPKINESTFGQALTRACRHAGVPHYTPHGLRHRWISLVLRAGVDPALAARVSGHKNIKETLDTYTHVLVDEPQERLNALRVSVYRVATGQHLNTTETENPAQGGVFVEVEDTGIEPVTFALPARRSPS